MIRGNFLNNYSNILKKHWENVKCAFYFFKKSFFDYMCIYIYISTILFIMSYTGFLFSIKIKPVRFFNNRLNLGKTQKNGKCTIDFNDLLFFGCYNLVLNHVYIFNITKILNFIIIWFMYLTYCRFNFCKILSNWYFN